jgi:hypothetical protein
MKRSTNLRSVATVNQHNRRKEMNRIRQGDVMLVPAKVPVDATKIKLRPIALGERTGHHHSLMTCTETPVEELVEMYEKDGNTYIRAIGEPSDVALVHQQHKAARLNEMEYVYVPQVENSDWGKQRVVD